MVSQKFIESEWGIHKLLVTGVKNEKMLAFKLGQFDIYLQSLDPIIPADNRKPFWNTPAVAVVRTPNKNNVSAFIKEMVEFKAYKVFKHALNLNELRLRGFVCNNVMNMMGLRPNATFYIKCDDRKIGDLFYTEAIRLADEHKFVCKFDFDEFDYTLEIRKYNKPDGKMGIVTILSGHDMPNDYRTSEFSTYRYRWRPSRRGKNEQ